MNPTIHRQQGQGKAGRLIYGRLAVRSDSCPCSGHAYLELLVVVPIFLMLFSMIAEVGILSHDWLVLVQAARQGLKLAEIRGGLDGEVLKAVRGQLTLGFISPEAVKITGTTAPVPWGQEVEIRLDYEYRFRITVWDTVAGLLNREYSIPLQVGGRTTSELNPVQ